MKIFRKILAFAVAMLCAMQVFAQTSGTCGDNLTWEFSGKVLRIKGSGAMYDYPSHGAPWYEFRSSIKILYLPDEMTHIGNHAFENIDEDDITLPPSLTSIGSYAFHACGYLHKVKCSSNVLTSIGTYAFLRCLNLYLITIPGSITTIDSDVFFDLTDLLCVHYKGTLDQWCAIDFANANANPLTKAKQLRLGSGEVQQAESVINAVIPEGTTTIKKYVFAEGKCIVFLSLPSTVSVIEKQAFYNCTNLQKITVNRDTPPSIQDDTFGGVPTDIEVFVPSGSEEAYRNDANWSRFTNIKAIPGPLAPGVYMNITTKEDDVYNFSTKDVKNVTFQNVTE